MLYMHFTRKTIRGTMMKQLVRIGRLLPSILDRENVNLGKVYTTELSENYHWPKGYSAITLTYKTAKMELLTKKNHRSDHIILQLHGGAYVSGYNDMYRRSALKYHRISGGVDVISLDYRLGPKNPYPAALEDAIAAYEYLRNIGYRPNNIIFVGDSAGGGLVLALSLYLRDHNIPLPKALITMSAWTDLAGEGESYLRNYTLDPMLGVGTKPLVVRDYTGDHDLHDPYISPAYGDFHHFVPMMMHVGSYEMLESDTLTVAKKASIAGSEVSVSIYRGMFHVFQLAFGLIPEANKAWREIGDFIRGQFNSTYQFRQ